MKAERDRAPTEPHRLKPVPLGEKRETHTSARRSNTRTLRASRPASSGRGVQPRPLADAERAVRAGRDAGSFFARVSIFRRLPGREYAGVAAYDRSQYVLHVAAPEPAARSRGGI